MHEQRQTQIRLASSAKTIGLILGTLGRQGSTVVYDNLKKSIKNSGKNYVMVLLSEIYPGKLDLFSDVDAWVQVACPRLSIDWGTAFNKPLLSPYELSVALKTSEWRSRYPMDFYAYDSAGNWTVNNESNRPARTKPRKKHISIAVEGVS